MKNKSLKSSIETVGEVVDEVIGFRGGEQKTFRNILTDSIQVGMMTQFKTTDGKLVYVNQNNVNWVEVFKR